jgi:putative flippase GtrA
MPKKSFFLFGVVGFIGFLADCIVLYIFKDWLGLYFVRILSFICAVFVTWNLNRIITFKNYDSGKSKIAEFLTYFSYMLAGGELPSI